MDISGIGSTAGAAPKSSSLSNFGQAKSMSDSQLVSMLPSPSMPGMGANLDLYAAIGKQAQGLLAGGRMAIESANISLGIDMKSPSTYGSSAPTADNTAGDTADSGSPAAGTAAKVHTNAILNDLLKADGYVAPAADPNVYQKDFFANPDSSKPKLGSQLNSLG